MPDSGDFPLSDAELVFLRELARAGSRFMIIGVGAAVLQGADAVTQDLDLWFRSLGDPAIARLLDLGLEPFLVTATLEGIVAPVEQHVEQSHLGAETTGEPAAHANVRFAGLAHGRADEDASEGGGLPLHGEERS